MRPALVAAALALAPVLASGAALAAPGPIVVCEPDRMTQMSVEPELVAVTWRVSTDTSVAPWNIRIEPVGSKRLPLIDEPAKTGYPIGGGRHVIEGNLLDEKRGTLVVQQMIYRYSVIVNALAEGPEVERGSIGYRLGPSDLLTKFVFECRRRGSALKAIPHMTANSIGGEG